MPVVQTSIGEKRKLKMAKLRMAMALVLKETRTEYFGDQSPNF
jgi:hypothetical protein